MKKFSQSVFLSDFNFIVVSYLIVPVAKLNIICERRTSTKLLKPSMVTPHYLFIIILVNTLGAELNEEKEKKKRKLSKFLMLEICLKIRKLSAKKLIFGGLVTMTTTSKKKSWLKQFFSLRAKKVPYIG